MEISAMVLDFLIFRSVSPLCRADAAAAPALKRNSLATTPPWFDMEAVGPPDKKKNYFFDNIVKYVSAGDGLYS